MAPVRAITELVTVAPIPSSLCEFATACLLSFRRIPADWLHREIEGPHSSIVPNPPVEGLFCLTAFRCLPMCHTGGILAAPVWWFSRRLMFSKLVYEQCSAHPQV
jgi:hypothetical protein